MTGRPGSSTLAARKSSQEDTVGQSILTELRRGKTVVLRVKDAWLPKKARAPEPRLFLVPFNRLGTGLSTKVLVSLETRGCEVIDTREEVKAITFIRLGLSAQMAKAVTTELNLVFK